MKAGRGIARKITAVRPHMGCRTALQWENAWMGYATRAAASSQHDRFPRSGRWRPAKVAACGRAVFPPPSRRDRKASEGTGHVDVLCLDFDRLCWGCRKGQGEATEVFARELWSLDEQISRSTGRKQRVLPTVSVIELAAKPIDKHVESMMIE